MEKQEQMYQLCKEDLEKSQQSEADNRARADELEEDLKKKKKEIEEVRQEVWI